MQERMLLLESLLDGATSMYLPSVQFTGPVSLSLLGAPGGLAKPPIGSYSSRLYRCLPIIIALSLIKTTGH